MSTTFIKEKLSGLNKIGNKAYIPVFKKVYGKKIERQSESMTDLMSDQYMRDYLFKT